MPELPEIEALAHFLHEKMAGQQVEHVDLVSIAALKTYDPPIDTIEGGAVKAVTRRGKYLLFEISKGVDSLWLVLHLARAGWVRYHESLTPGKARPRKGPLSFRLLLTDGRGIEITEAGTEKRLAVWAVRHPEEVQGVASLGVEPLGGELSDRSLAQLLSHDPHSLKAALSDQKLIAGIGNAYSDEILHAARMSPFRSACKLGLDEVKRLHQAIVDVLEEAVERSKGLPASGLKSEKRSGMSVHGRTGQDCPVCGDVVREVSFSSRSLQYCATCQTGG